MIGCTKLLCGQATVSEALNYGRDTRKLPPHLLQFSSDARPLVVWNTTNRCNLLCEHCYINAEDRDYSGELTTEEAISFIEDLGEMQIPVLLFSGGEPLLRKELFDLGRMAAEKGLRPVISTNGTLITPEKAKAIKEAGFQYVGVSIDGAEKKHDEFRGVPGAFQKAITGIKNSLEAGVKAGVRFTVNAKNIDDLPVVMELVERERIPRFCMYHLVYAGRGKEMLELDTTHAQKREIIEFLVRKSFELKDKGLEIEILTTDNHADGVYIYQYVLKHLPERAEEVWQLLKMHGGCSAGVKMSNVDPFGNVHACQFWGHRTLGNVKEQKFSEIWRNSQDEFLVMMRDKAAHVKGRCAACKYTSICGGCRIRAEVVHGDMWAEDPACYLTDEEIGIVESAEKVG
ncbi:MAG: radical SAM protein [Firmicutes bacterium]|nr:radical SAM protein [Bacillota bacterium]